jgi:MoxR-like ATPase
LAAATPSRSAAQLRERIAALLGRLEEGLVERRRAVRLALLVALAGEHTLLIGPPGTAKSELARRLHLAFAGASYFERLLTRFTVPEELFGPLSISALEDDRYERITAGFLPEAGIAFIDEVFKANSAILNALLTLLNEREFDNGAGRQACPLISVIGATNEVPDDEVDEAFFDRFLLRQAVGPVSAAGFRELLQLGATRPPAAMQPLDAQDRAALARAADAARLGDDVVRLLAELRAKLHAEGVYVSDRRWLKVVWLLKVAAASEERNEVVGWDLWLLPGCVAPDPSRQDVIAGWLAARLGIEPDMAPPLLTRVVEAFEAQAQVERDAEDLDYDDSGRLKFTADVADQVNDAKGAAQAMRMSYRRQRRYGASHIGARLRQIDALIERIDVYAMELAAQQHELAAYAGQSLWLDHEFADRADANLATTAEAIIDLRRRAAAARAAFAALPRLAQDPGVVPEPIAETPRAG